MKAVVKAYEMERGRYVSVVPESTMVPWPVLNCFLVWFVQGACIGWLVGVRRGEDEIDHPRICL